MFSYIGPCPGVCVANRIAEYCEAYLPSPLSGPALCAQGHKCCVPRDSYNASDIIVPTGANGIRGNSTAIVAEKEQQYWQHHNPKTTPQVNFTLTIKTIEAYLIKKNIYRHFILQQNQQLLHIVHHLHHRQQPQNLVHQVLQERHVKENVLVDYSLYSAMISIQMLIARMKDLVALMHRQKRKNLNNLHLRLDNHRLKDIHHRHRL